MMKKSHDRERLNSEGTSLVECVDSGKEAIKQQVAVINERWDAVNKGMLIYIHDRNNFSLIPLLPLKTCSLR